MSKSNRRLRRHSHPNLPGEVYKRTIHAVEKSYWDEQTKAVKSIWVEESTGKVIDIIPKRSYDG